MSVECTPPTLVSISSSQSPLSAKLCSMSIHRSVRELEFYCVISKANAHFLCYRHSLEGRRSLSVKYTPPTLVYISSSPSPLSVKFCPMSVHWSVQELEFYCLISKANAHFLCYRQILEGLRSLSVESTPPTLEFISSSPSSLSVKVCPTSVHRSVQELKFYSLVNRLKPISYTIGIFRRAVVGCLSNAHLKVWYPSAPLHHLCLLIFVPWMSINLFKN